MTLIFSVCLRLSVIKVNMVLGGKMVWACHSLSLGSGYSGVPSAFGRPLRAPPIPHAMKIAPLYHALVKEVGNVNSTVARTLKRH